MRMIDLAVAQPYNQHQLSTHWKPRAESQSIGRLCCHHYVRPC